MTTHPHFHTSLVNHALSILGPNGEHWTNTGASTPNFVILPSEFAWASSNYCTCLGIALNMAEGKFPTSHLYKALEDFTEGRYKLYSIWNDEPERTFEDILKFLSFLDARLLTQGAPTIQENLLS